MEADGEEDTEGEPLWDGEPLPEEERENSEAEADWVGVCETLAHALPVAHRVGDAVPEAHREGDAVSQKVCVGAPLAEWEGVAVP